MNILTLNVEKKNKKKTDTFIYLLNLISPNLVQPFFNTLFLYRLQNTEYDKLCFSMLSNKTTTKQEFVLEKVLFISEMSTRPI